MSEVITKELGQENRNEEGQEKKQEMRLEKEQEREQEEEEEQEKELTWQVDLAELNLQVSHPTASTSSPQLIFLISQSFLKRTIALIRWSCARITCKFCRPPRTLGQLFLGSSWGRREHES